MLPSQILNTFESMKAQALSLENTKPAPKNTLDEETWARMTICKWRANAQIHGKEQTKADCDRLLQFINSICCK